MLGRWQCWNGGNVEMAACWDFLVAMLGRWQRWDGGNVGAQSNEQWKLVIPIHLSVIDNIEVCCDHS
uniref:Uncharacterized protein n=1 Tax=Romanomermis culicivorax TaxID=13658 RepID=A0A915L0N7_ROMCU